MSVAHFPCESTRCAFNLGDVAGRYPLEVKDLQQRVVRHGHLSEREVMTGLVAVISRVCAIARRTPPIPTASGSRRRSRLPLCVARSRSRRCAADPLPEGDIDRRLLRALAALLGKDAGGLRQAKRYVYIVSGVLFTRSFDGCGRPFWHDVICED